MKPSISVSRITLVKLGLSFSAIIFYVTPAAFADSISDHSLDTLAISSVSNIGTAISSGLNPSDPCPGGVTLLPVAPAKECTIDNVTPEQLDFYIKKATRASSEAVDDPARWTIDGTNLTYEGDIRPGDCKTLKSKLDRTQPRIRSLTVNSFGGDANEGLCMGILVRNSNLDVIVDGNCGSSCANYLFAAGHTKTIRAGYVGFHGNMTAMSAHKKEIIASIRSQSKHLKLSPEKTKQAIAYFETHILISKKHESDFFSSLGVSQAFFDLTGQSDKGEGSGKIFEFLLPSPMTFAKYGFRDVVGTQDRCMANVLFNGAVLYR
jgi:hypothetical protein